MSVRRSSTPSARTIGVVPASLPSLAAVWGAEDLARGLGLSCVLLLRAAVQSRYFGCGAYWRFFKSECEIGYVHVFVAHTRSFGGVMAELRNRLKKERRKRGKYSCKGREDAIRMKEDRQCTISHRKLGDATRLHHLVTDRQSKINNDDGCACSHFPP